MYCLNLLSHPSNLIQFHSKWAILWKIYVADNNGFIVLLLEQHFCNGNLTMCSFCIINLHMSLWEI